MLSVCHSSKSRSNFKWSFLAKGGHKVVKNGPGHTTDRLMILKLCMKHHRLKLYKVGINDDPGLTLTLTNFTARSNWSHMHLNGENCYKLILLEKFCRKRSN